MTAKRKTSALDRALFAVVAGGIAVAAGWALLGGPGVDWRGGTPAPPAPPTTAEVEQQVRTLCKVCHAFPEPDILPRDVWPLEIEKMYEFAGVSEDVDPSTVPPIEATLRFYKERAPEMLPAPQSYAALGPGPLRFEASGIAPPELHAAPAVSYVRMVAFLDATRKDLLFTDMRSGEIVVERMDLPDRPRRVLATLSHPAHAEVVDLDGDGRRDLLVAELGSFLPADHDLGKVVWLRGRADGTLEPITLLDKVGRVADVQAADYDGDGDLDLAVAVFGWRKTGKVVVLENRGLDDRGLPRFAESDLDPRQGAITVPFVDLNGDGKLDIVVLLSQQYETVVAYLNDGKGWFKAEVVYAAPHPDWGSSSLEAVDLDEDGDLDLITTCGDTLDTSVFQRHQGVYWLENEGAFPFRVHQLAELVGAHKVRAADLDGDGDLDLAASAFLPQLHTDAPPAVGRLDSVLWIEQTAPGKFQPHTIETERCEHPCLEIADLTGDGRLDIVVGDFYVTGLGQFTVNWLTLFARR